MKLHIMSDLHLEFGGMDLTPVGDVLVLAGDIHVGNRAKDWIAQACKHYNAVIYVPGNHEFYNGEYYKVLVSLEDMENDLLNLFVLDNTTAVLGDVRFIGTTLWTSGTKPIINDYAVIAVKDAILKIEDTQAFHAEAVNFLLDELAKPFIGKTVVVTHHAPIPECVVPKFYGNPINEMFHANLGPIIQDNDIALWVHGHMHDSIKYNYHNTEIVCNPRGYVGYGANWGFRDDLVVDV